MRRMTDERVKVLLQERAWGAHGQALHAFLQSKRFNDWLGHQKQTAFISGAVVGFIVGMLLGLIH